MTHSIRPDGMRSSQSPEHAEVRHQHSSAGLVTCYITKPDKNVFNVDVENKADGQELLNKVCRELAILDESAYFGIQFVSTKGDLLWINTRNRLSKQIPSHPPYHLLFKVKYFVPPHTLMLEETRHQFYLNVAQNLELGLWYSETSNELQARLIALMTYIKHGVFNPKTTPCKYACFWPEHLGEMSADLLQLAANHHKELSDMPLRNAEYELLRITHLEVPAYGLYFYNIKNIFNRRLLMGVGPEFVAICALNTAFMDRYPFCSLHTVTVANRVVTLNIVESDGSVKPKNFQLASSLVANSVYRLITEMHCFFRCDSVRGEVLTQTNHDLMETFTSIFDHGSKDYTFDVQFTCREVYDRAKRHLYNTANDLAAGSLNQENFQYDFHDPPNSATGGLPYSRDPKHMDTTRSHSGSATSTEVHEIVQERLREAGICKVCMDNPINRVFFPCGHTLCCEICADRLDQCPICRKNIEIRHPCFLPWNVQLDEVKSITSTQKVAPRSLDKHRNIDAYVVATDNSESQRISQSSVPSTITLYRPKAKSLEHLGLPGHDRHFSLEANVTANNNLKTVQSSNTSLANFCFRSFKSATLERSKFIAASLLSKVVPNISPVRPTSKDGPNIWAPADDTMINIFGGPYNQESVLLAEHVHNRQFPSVHEGPGTSRSGHFPDPYADIGS